jgi:hypothetical protein
MKIIGISGKARSGKDSLATYFVRNHGFRRIGMADPIKRAVCAMFRDPTMFDDSRKEKALAYLPEVSPRMLAQTLGTEWGRNTVSGNLWVALMLREAALLKAERVVVPDVRFENEAAAIRDRGGCIIHIERPGVDGAVRAHSSEDGIAFEPGDFRILNEFSLDALYGMAEGVWSEIVKREERVGMATEEAEA